MLGQGPGWFHWCRYRGILETQGNTRHVHGGKDLMNTWLPTEREGPGKKLLEWASRTERQEGLVSYRKQTSLSPESDRSFCHRLGPCE